MIDLSPYESRQLRTALKDGREHLEQSEHCSGCGDLVDIREINLSNLKCKRCFPGRKITARDIEKAMLAIKIKYNLED